MTRTWTCWVVAGVAGAAVAAVTAALVGSPQGRAPRPVAAAQAGPAAAGGDGPALATAREFITLWWSSDWRDPSGAQAARVAALAGGALLRALEGPAGTGDAPVLATVERAEHRQVVVDDAVAVVADRDGPRLGIAVTATATVDVAGSPPLRAPVAMEVLEAPGAAGWRVVAVDQ